MNLKKNKKKAETPEEKLELAQVIAEKSEKITKRTEAVGESFMKLIRWLSAGFDRVLFNPKHSKLVAFGIALLLYFAFNSTGVTSTRAPQHSITIDSVPVVLNYNSEMYEVTGYEKAVTVFVNGDFSEVNAINQQSADLKVELDLSGLTEGEHRVQYKVSGLSGRVRTVIEPASASIKIKTKEASNMALGYDFINQDKLGAQYVVGEPTYVPHRSEVSIKGSKETLEKVALVKALIDVSGRTETFTTDAMIVAYDQQGERIDTVDIIPNKVTVEVPISSPNKRVPIVPVFEGEIPNGKAISSFEMDNEAITIYAEQSVLDSIDDIKIPISAATLTEDVKMVHTISLPTKVRNANVTKVNLDIKLGDAETRTFNDIPINYAYNNNNLKAELVDVSKATTTLTVTGTKEKLDEFDVNKVYVYVNMRDLEPDKTYNEKLYIRSEDGTGANFAYYRMKLSDETFEFKTSR